MHFMKRRFTRFFHILRSSKLSVNPLVKNRRSVVNEFEMCDMWIWDDVLVCSWHYMHWVVMWWNIESYEPNEEIKNEITRSFYQILSWKWFVWLKLNVMFPIVNWCHKLGWSTDRLKYRKIARIYLYSNHSSHHRVLNDIE